MKSASGRPNRLSIAHGLPDSRGQANFAVALLLSGAVFVAYAGTLRNGFVWDDDSFLTENKLITQPDGLSKIWLSPLETPQYYPLYFTAYWLEYRLWGLHPAGYHAVNILLHIGNVLLVWQILKALRLKGAFVAAAIFGLHPVQVESVAWVTEQRNVLSAFFYLASVYTYLQFDPPEIETASARRNWRAWVGAFALFVCALLSKTVTCTLPAAMLVLYWWKGRKLSWRTMLPLIPFFVVGIAISRVTVEVERSFAASVELHLAIDRWDRPIIAGRAVWFYLGKLLWPAALSTIYPHWVIDSTRAIEYLPAAAAIVTLILLWVLRNRIGRGPLAAGLLFCGTLAPMLGFFDINFMYYSFVADRFQYLASLGLISALAVVLHQFLLRGRFRVWGAVAVFMIVTALGARTSLQCRRYRDCETYFGTLIEEKSPHTWLAHYDLAVVRTAEHQYEAAMEELRESVRENPSYPPAHNNLGWLFGGQGKTDEAIREYQKAIELRPRWALAHNNLAAQYIKAGRDDDAVEQFRLAVEIKPEFQEARMNLAKLLARMGRVAEAREQYREVLRRDRTRVAAQEELDRLPMR